MSTTDWSIKITKCSNGFIATDLSDDEAYHGIYVMEECALEHPELNAGLTMLCHVMDFFNLQGSKHDLVRLKVRLEKQSHD